MSIRHTSATSPCRFPARPEKLSAGRYRRYVPRPPRVQVAGGLYHVTQRSTDQEILFADLYDRVGFEQLLRRTATRYAWEIHDYCELTNHFHLLVLTREPTIAVGMQYLNARHVEGYNGRHGRRGTLVEGRYGAELVETEQHYLQARGYIAFNPVGAGLVRDPADWSWSGFGGGGKVAPCPDERMKRFVRAYCARRATLRDMALQDVSGL